ncbi:MAG: cyclase family protein [Acholeplasmataceae bacterium]|nr:cyclase family protein [Acholeplasmataceae bacterium]
MKIYDVSMTITPDMQVYKNLESKKPIIEVVSDFSNSSAHETKLSMNLHTGTHMDFPLHMIENGLTSDALDITRLITPVKVFDMTHLDQKITEEDLKKLDIQISDFLLFKTINSYDEKFISEFVYIDESASLYLASKKISGVGVDGLGVERNQANHPTHKNLMKNDIIIIEGLRLKDVKQGNYFMYALPIKIQHSDALPLSVILLEEPYEHIPSKS